MTIPNKIDRFIVNIQQRLNGRLASSLLSSALSVAVGVVWLWALAAVFGLITASPWYYPVPAVIAFSFFCWGYWRQHYDRYRAASYADRWFDLQDSLVSILNFAEQQSFNAFHQLASHEIEKRCNELDSRQLKIHFPWFKLFVNLCLAVPALMLLLAHNPSSKLSPSRTASQLEQLTDKVNRQLRRQFSSLRQELSPAEKRLLEQTELPKKLPKLPRDKDFKTAMLRYAAIERTIDKLAANSQLNNNRRLLQAIARQLLRERDTRSLGKEFQRGSYRRALRQLKKLKHQAVAEGKTAPLRRALTTMHDAATGQVPGTNRLKKSIDRLLQALKNYSQNGQSKQKQLSAKRELDYQLEQLSQELQQQQTAESFIHKLAKLRQALQLAQQKLRNLNSSAGAKSRSGTPMSRGRGRGDSGETAGATNDDRRHKTSQNSLSTAGDLSKLNGKIGHGLSQKELARASSGNGVSRRLIRNNNRDFHRQLEELVKRHEVPENMKEGVKNYFNALQESNTPDSLWQDNKR